MIMNSFISSINNRSASFKSNKKAMLKLIDDLNKNLDKTKILGSETALDQAKKREIGITFLNIQNKLNLKQINNLC